MRCLLVPSSIDRTAKSARTATFLQKVMRGAEEGAIPCRL
jgi:hypothetical protein